MDTLKNVLIKEVTGHKQGDMVIYVDNLPKHLLYKRAKKLMIDYTNPQQNLVPCFKMVDGRKIETEETFDELLPGIEMSQTGDGAFCFFTQYNEAKYRLRDIDNYLRATVPVSERLAERIPYAAQPGLLTSGTIPLNAIPRVVLPEPVSPPAKAVQEATVPAQGSILVKHKRKPLTEEQRAAARERIARARSFKKQTAQ